MSDPRLHRLFNRARIDDRQINELIGLAHGITADGTVNQAEAEFLRKWLAANTAVSDNPVVATLFSRVNEMLIDGDLDPEESQDLLETLRRFSAGDFELGEVLKATRLPIDTPQPEIAFEGSRFCFTGTFAFGSRRDCEAAVLERGGEAGSLVRSTHYLVIGVYATDAWANSSFGRKIEKAVGWRTKGAPISILSEEHWVANL
ncbi:MULTISPECIES: BRCT domain-containing protein [unclassified Iodidimonas]|jgi:NAD-dependent DNA ligase|uniref:BRCT domain-containing protein n=1 Tax=unclassified Iodidimonas TaxID=2626145 RepID=UPI00248264F1|nr:MULTISPECIES: BRCT domain-containing protein [unclassified Iodidimonas]